MNDVKTIIITIIGAIFTLLAPIQNFMYAMLLLFGLNFIFGLVAAIVNREGWSTRKALFFIWYCAIFLITARRSSSVISWANASRRRLL